MANTSKLPQARQALPPELFNVEAERVVLGAAMLNSQEVLQFPTVAALRADDFWDARHRDIWAAICTSAAAGSVDVVTLANELYQRGQLEAVGGMAALMDLMNGCVSYTHAESNAAIVLEWAKRRRVADLISGLGAALSKDGPFDAALRETVDKLSAELLTGIGPVESCSMDAIRAFYGDVTWAWKGWLPVGHLSLLVGPQACGKSYLAARLIASLSGCCEYWPDGTPVGGYEKLPCRVLLVETEEMRGVYAQRLETLGVSGHWVLCGPGDETHIPDLLEEAQAIERLARQEEIGAIVVDSLSGGHGLREESAEMRRVLRVYATMAARLHIPIVLVHHVRKRGELEPTTVTLDRVRGSSTITQFCRSVIALYRLQDSDQVSPVRVESIKATFCAPPKPLGFTITDAGLSFCDAPEPIREESQLDKARDLLKALLKDGPVAVTELQDEADGAGISWDTMKRAKNTLGIVAKRDRERWYWALPVVL